MNVRIHVAAKYTQPLARRFLAVMNEAGPKCVALSGGNTPRDFFQLLAGELRARVPWDRIEFFQVDERRLPKSQTNSNWLQLRELLFDPVPEARAHPMDTARIECAEEYDTLLCSKLPLTAAGIPVFDVVLLGLGADGHTASLFPGTKALDETRLHVLHNPVPALKAERVTLTYPVLNAARHRWFVLRGANRRKVFRETIDGQHPAGRIRDPEWFVEPETIVPPPE